jgi:hypothetical protein
MGVDDYDPAGAERCMHGIGAGLTQEPGEQKEIFK